ncbi:DUF4824 family protein [Pseudomonas sp. 5P_3.1_Bac2]|uniref:DUF4824 family protein n=1 Tax=Pseudomonas sp. 5P_3.1_Bac2 TaxID=2971617 RepID=UPI0021CABAE9|nr:DUF4824 family protein [Pseudomonas sp. 5P_3.1_Bac2]MCU1716991.1 DUF4824 family protein [Pseudomonas sp. 5P_3.1_Bac2]
MSGRRRYLLLSISLIVALNAWLLGSVWWNRQEPVDSQLQLSQRELPQYRSSYSAGLRLKRELHISYRWPDQQAENLSVEQMSQLGFDLQRCERQRYSWQPSREAFMVLELNGPAYQQELARAKQRLENARAALRRQPARKARQQVLQSAEKDYQRTEQVLSRLLVVAVGVDAQQLRQQYGQRTMYAIVPAVVEARLDYSAADHQAQCTGYARMANTQLSVPLALRQPGLASATAQDLNFTAQVAFGRTLEPWLQTVQVQP